MALVCPTPCARDAGADAGVRRGLLSASCSPESSLSRVINQGLKLGVSREINLDVRTPRFDPQSLTVSKLEGNAHQLPRDAASAKRWWHFRVSEDHPVAFALVGSKRLLAVNLHLETLGRGIVANDKRGGFNAHGGTGAFTSTA